MKKKVPTRTGQNTTPKRPLLKGTKQNRKFETVSMHILLDISHTLYILIFYSVHLLYYAIQYIQLYYITVVYKL